MACTARLARGFVLSGLLLAGAAPGSARQPGDPPPGGEPDSALVVLVHGMGRTSRSMRPLQRSLERAGYRVLNVSYSSYGPTIAEIGARLGRRLDAELAARPAPRVHFVGHSLGNIVVRWLLVNRPPPAVLGRFVMLAPPNRGARVADRLTPFVGWLLRPISELRTQASTVSRLPAPTGIAFAIIAGARDGKVQVAETCLPGARAHAVVASGHTFILRRPEVIGMVHDFLSGGRFVGPATSPSCP